MTQAIPQTPPGCSSATCLTRDGRPILIRSCRGFEELDACVQLQIDTWGYADGDVIPRRAFIVAQHIGGQIVGAFDVTRAEGSEGTAENMIGFAMSLPGVKPAPDPREDAPVPYLHSHMLAVSAGYRNDGIGRQLKLFQRLEALDRGFDLMEWTFDPLEIKNSFLNIHKLGVIVRAYTPNFYGVSSSRLQGRLPTDRLHAEWYLRSKRVQASIAEAPVHHSDIEETIMIPYQVGEWKSSEPGIHFAQAVQAENRQRFQRAFSRGLAVVGFRRDDAGNGIFELAPFEHVRSSYL
ncbi:MAG TPA: GNAT family N-acetyltransferase [Silvibacterium sp.]|nr:GNAT family N-acetyltransferase [Silvibacterium sp.]